MGICIEVTARDVANGEPCSAKLCPVALAIRRATGFEFALVGIEKTTFGDQVLRTVDLPFDVGEIIAAYDRTGQMEPFGLELKLKVETGGRK